LLSLLYPPRCPACARDLRRVPAAALCRACLRALGALAAGCPCCGEPGPEQPCTTCRTAPPAFRRARACFPYVEGGLARELVARWKFRGDHVVGAALGRLLAAHRARCAGCYDVVVPVPLHRSRLASRGFNQAALLARAALRPGERIALGALVRRTPTRHQLALGRRERAGNVGDAFLVRDARVLRDRSVLLVDDVLTSGATADACARLMLEAGARLVDVWTLARTPRRLSASGAGKAAPAARAGAA
jgi:ComF family protein